MNRGAWWATVRGVKQRVGMIDQLTLSQLQPFPLQNEVDIVNKTVSFSGQRNIG